MRISFALCLLAVSVTVHAQNSPARHAQPAIKTFTSADGAFQFKYPDTLIVCQKKSNGGDGYLWAPAESCAAYHPVCDGLTPENFDGLACLAYPRDKHTDTGVFEAATFSVEVLAEASAQSCQGKPADEIFTTRTPITIDGVAFTNYEFGEGGMNQSVSGNVYRAFHHGKCYQLGINQATANSGVFDPPPREMSKEDWDAVLLALRQARDSFRFLK